MTATQTSPLVHVHELKGCGPIPLAAYLKALGVLRLIGQQRDAGARLWFEGDRVLLSTVLDADELLRFFTDEYAPTPVLAPWNGGSGFYPKDNRAARESIVSSTTTRLEPFRSAFSAADEVMASVEAKPEGADKVRLLEQCRGALPDEALEWLDAACVLLMQPGGDVEAKYPPLLGTGGNDGRLDFTNNFQQRLLDVLSTEADASPPSDSLGLLEASLFGAERCGLLSSAAIGQFLPGDAGGANATAGYDAPSLINPWDFVLMLEGAVLFAASAVRALEDTGGGMGFAYPFTVRSVAAGYGTAGTEDTRAEMFLPLWRRGLTATETQALLSEGRARVGRRRAKNGIDFARAIASLGVDRGIEAFQRIGFQVRNGLSYFAVPLGRLPVHRDVEVELLGELDAWLSKFVEASHGERAPASIKRAAHHLEDALFALCGAPSTEKGPRLLQLLVALGNVERQLTRSQKWAQDAFVQPVPPLSTSWLVQVPVSEVEARLALAAASLWAPHEFERRRQQGQKKLRANSLRESLESVFIGHGKHGPYARVAEEGHNEVVWREGPLANTFCHIAHRRLLAAEQGTSTKDKGIGDRHSIVASLGDIAAFVDGRVDDERLADLLWGFALIHFGSKGESRVHIEDINKRVAAEVRGAREHLVKDGEKVSVFDVHMPPALYALMRLALAPVAIGKTRDGEEGVHIPFDRTLLRLGSTGQGRRASEVASRRLRASGFPPAVTATSDADAERCTAALVFPVHPSAYSLTDGGSLTLADLVLRTQKRDR